MKHVKNLLFLTITTIKKVRKSFEYDPYPENLLKSGYGLEFDQSLFMARQFSNFDLTEVRLNSY